MNRGFGETLIAIGLVFMLFALALSLVGCANIDVNGYRAKGGSTGSATCKGACP